MIIEKATTIGNRGLSEIRRMLEGRELEEEWMESKLIRLANKSMQCTVRSKVLGRRRTKRPPTNNDNDAIQLPPPQKMQTMVLNKLRLSTWVGVIVRVAWVQSRQLAQTAPTSVPGLTRLVADS